MRRVVVMFCIVSLIATAGCSGGNGGEESDSSQPDGRKDTATADVSPDASEPDTTSTGEDAGEPDAADPDAAAADAPGQDAGGEDTGKQDAGAPRFETVDCSSVTAAKTVTVGPGYKYVPSSVEIGAGETVKWDWADDLKLKHDVVGGGTCGSPKRDWFESSRSKSTDTTFCVTFNQAGEVDYQCTLPGHCKGGMTGTVVVK